MIAALLLACSVLSGPAPASKGPFPLCDRVDRSTFICVGRVVEVIEVRLSTPARTWRGELEVVPIARVAIERTLKGDRAIKELHHEAWGTWACDTTSAKVGERALLLLRPTVANNEAVERAIGSVPVFRNVGSGDGILRIGMSPRGPVTSSADVPDALRVEGRGGAYDFAEVLRYVEELVAFAPDVVAVHARVPYAYVDPERSFDLRILDDGRARLARQLDRQERVSTFQLDPDAWRTLRGELELRVRDEHRRVRMDPDHLAARRLELRIGEGSLDSDPRGDGDRLALREILECWALVRAAIDCPECADHAEADAEWLRRAR